MQIKNDMKENGNINNMSSINLRDIPTPTLPSYSNNNKVEINPTKYRHLSPKEREKLVIEAHNLDNITKPDINTLNKISEGVWSKFEKGNSLVPSVYIGTKTYDIPLVSEEASVVAAIQKVSKLSNLNGIEGSSDEHSEMTGQIPFKKNATESIDELITYIKPFKFYRREFFILKCLVYKIRLSWYDKFFIF